MQRLPPDGPSAKITRRTCPSRTRALTLADEDSPFNPGVIADNVGDNVGDVAGMGSDLFGSFGEASCAALLIGASCLAIEEAGWAAIVFPLYIASAGLLVCLVTSFLATDIMPVKKEEDIEVNRVCRHVLLSALVKEWCRQIGL